MKFPNKSDITLPAGETTEVSFYIISPFKGAIEIDVIHHDESGLKNRTSFINGKLQDLFDEIYFGTAYKLYAKNFRATNGTLFRAEVTNNREYNLLHMDIILTLIHSGHSQIPDVIAFNISFAASESSTRCPTATVPDTHTDLPINSTPSATPTHSTPSVAPTNSTPSATPTNSTPSAIPTNSTPSVTPSNCTGSDTPITTSDYSNATVTSETTPVENSTEERPSVASLITFPLLASDAVVNLALHLATIFLLILLLCTVCCQSNHCCRRKPALVDEVFQQYEARQKTPPVDDSDNEVDPRILENDAVEIRYEE